MEVNKNGEINPRVFPVRQGDFTALGGIICKVVSCKYGRQQAIIRIEQEGMDVGTYPTVGDKTSLGGIPCEVIFANKARQTVTLQFQPGCRIYDSHEKDLTVRKFQPMVNRRDKRAYMAMKPRAERLKLQAKRKKAKKNDKLHKTPAH